MEREIGWKGGNRICLVVFYLMLGFLLSIILLNFYYSFVGFGSYYFYLIGKEIEVYLLVCLF